MDSVAPQDKTSDKKLRNEARAEKPADGKKPAASQDTKTEAKAVDQDEKAAPQDNESVASKAPDAKTEEPAADTAEDAAQAASGETGDATLQIAQPAAQPATQTSPSLLAALQGDTAQMPEMPVATPATAATPDATAAIDDVQLAAATAQNAAAKPAAQMPADAKLPQSGEAQATDETAATGQTPDANTAATAANDNAAPEAPQTKAAPAAIAAEPAAKPAPQAASTNMAVQAPVAQPQAAAANANNPAPQMAQHVDVSATPKPNMTSLAVEISAKSQSGAKQFDIRLDPPELGRVEVRLSIDATGKASAHLSADQPQTLDLLQKDASILTRALRDAGLDMSQNSLNFSLRQQAQGQQGGEQRSHGRASRNHLTATQSIEATSASATYRANGGVDIRV
jgi:flagellar hook-length control protein FliK